MVTKEEARILIQRMADNRPKAFFKQFDDTNAGIGCVLRYLSEADRPVSSGEISEFMHVSTARVAVLLRKMAEKNLILKNGDPDDARKTMVTLSEHGMECVKEKQEEFLNVFCTVVDQVGKERMEQFIEISADIKKAVEETIAKKS